MGSGLFWGIVLIIVGLSLIIKVVFKIDFPIFKVLAAFLFIYLGIKILLGNFSFTGFHPGQNDVVFGESSFVHERTLPSQQNVLFGKGTIDLRNISADGFPAQMTVNTVFGNSIILLNKNIPVKVFVDAAFAGVSLPDGNSVAFGSSHYQTPAFAEGKPFLKIKADAVFGSVHVIAE